jgi:plasmid stabilization system protein ParE
VSREVRFTPLAADDVVRAFEWYESQRSGLGAEFETVVEQMLKLLREMPELGPEVHSDFRRVLLVRFPYALYYRIADVIEVRGCLHLRQSPEAWHRRV